MLRFLFLSLLVVHSVYSAQNEGVKALDSLDQYFVAQYHRASSRFGKETFPVLINKGFEYELVLDSKRSKKFKGPIPPFDGLKAISHIGPCLFALGEPSWKDLDNPSWKGHFLSYRKKVREALRTVDLVNWSNPAWPEQTQQLQEMMRDSLMMAEEFMTKIIKRGVYTQEDYQSFAEKYLPTMTTTMYLADLSNTTAAYHQLKKWKEDLDEKWDNLYVIVIGSKGRTTAALTLQTNASAQTIASLMSPEKAKSNIIIAPTASSKEEALNVLGTILNARALAKATFMTKESQQVSGFYEALQHPTIPLALNNIEKIIKSLEKGEIIHPVLGIGPNREVESE